MEKNLKTKQSNFFTKNLKIIESIFGKTNLLVYIKNKDDTLIYKNQEFENFLMNLKKGPDNDEQLRKSLQKDTEAIKKKSNIADLKEKYILASKKKIYLLTNKSIIENELGQLLGVINISKNTTNLKKEIDIDLYYAKHDPLTGFLNKKSFTNKFQEEINRATRTGHKLGILYLDLDNFKSINDNYGHIQGDYLLVEITKRLKKIFRTTDHLGRFGGDEFVILITNIKKGSNIKKLLENLIKKINKTVSKPINIEDKEIVTEVSTGYSYYPDKGKDVKTLIQISDLEMYRVKKSKYYNK